MIFIDSNVPMYLVGAEHPNKARARRLLDDCFDRNERLVTDVEALQEILHRYDAIRRRDAIQPAFDLIREIIDEVYPVEPADVEDAKEILLGNERLSARDSLHLSVMRRYGVESIMTFDQGFDRVPASSGLPEPVSGVGERGAKPPSGSIGLGPVSHAANGDRRIRSRMVAMWNPGTGYGFPLPAAWDH